MRPCPPLADPPRPGLVDAAFRLAFRLGYRLMRGWWRLRRPRHDGAVVAVWHGGRILMLRHSYRDTLGWPGGGIGRGEAPQAAARRELLEELGLAVGAEALALATETTTLWEHRRDHVRVFEVTLSQLPVFRLDNREVVAARFMAPEDVLALPVAPFIRAYLEDARARRA